MLLPCTATAITSSFSLDNRQHKTAEYGSDTTASYSDNSCMDYPKVGRSSDTIAVGKVSAPDPYRYLEDEINNLGFVEAQNKFAESFIQNSQYYDEISQIAADIATCPQMGTPSMQRDGYIYWTYNDGTRNHAIFYRVRVIDTTIHTAPLGERSKWEIFFDPNTLSKNGQFSVHNYSWSYSGKYFCYSVSEAGRTAQKIIIMNSYTKEKLETLDGCAIAQYLNWYKDEGLLYNNATETKSNNSGLGIYFHKVETTPSNDVLVWKQERRRQATRANFSEDYRLLIIEAYEETDPPSKNLYFCGIDRNDEDKFLNLTPSLVHSQAEDGLYHYIGTVEDDVIMRTNADGAFNYKLVAFGINEPYSKLCVKSKKQSKQDLLSLTPSTVIDHQENQVLINAYVFARTCMILIYAIDGSHRVCLWDVSAKNNIKLRRDSTMNQIKIPMDASIGHVWCTNESNTIFIAYETLAMPFTILKGIYDPLRKDFRFVMVFKPSVNGMFTQDYVTERVFYPSKDGSNIAMFLTYPSNLDTSVPSPTLLHLRGGFGPLLSTGFDPFLCAFMRIFNGVLAMPDIRYNNDMGNSEWKNFSGGLRSQDEWNDFQYAAKYLIERKVTNPSMMTMWGTSDGALLVAGTMMQEPNICSCVITDGGLYDLLRDDSRHSLGLWHLNENQDCQGIFSSLKERSPIHNILSPRSSSNNGGGILNLRGGGGISFWKSSKQKQQQWSPNGRDDSSIMLSPPPSPGFQVALPYVFVSVGLNDDCVPPWQSYKYIATLQHARRNVGIGGPVALMKAYKDQGHDNITGKTLAMMIKQVTDRLVFISASLNLVVPRSLN